MEIQHNQINLARKYYLEVYSNQPLIKTEPVYWRYKYYLESLKKFNVLINSRLENSMIILRKKHLEENLK